MEKQKKDEKRGATYGAGVVIESYTFQIPSAIKVIQKKKKLELNSHCSWESFYRRDGHKTNRAKGYKYYGKTDDDAFIKTMKKYLLEAYPEYYGALNFDQLFEGTAINYLLTYIIFI